MSHQHDRPLVTVGIPTFERLPGLLRALEAARSQTYKELEILVADNCSSGYDVTVELADVMRVDSRVHVFRHERNLGPSANSSFLCRRATGTWLIWMADDDYCEPEMIERLVETALSDGQVVLAACDVTVVDTTDKRMSTAQLVEVRPDAPWTLARRRFFRYPTSNIFFCIYGLHRLDALRAALPLLEPPWKGYETNNEVPFLAKIATQGKIWAIARPLKYYRSHEQSVYTREIKQIGAFDHWMIRLMIRARLLLIASTADMPVKERLVCVVLVLYDAILGERSWLRGVVRRCLPAPLVKLLKTLLRRAPHRQA